MTSESAVWNMMGAALWTAPPVLSSDDSTTTPRQRLRRARQLAVALGYPQHWCVVREWQPLVDPNHHQQQQQSQPPKMVIVDRIYAGNPDDNNDVDMWLHHADAMAAATQFPEHSGYDSQGGHRLPRIPQFHVGQSVQVLYEDTWWDAKIVRRKEHARHGYQYQVYYPSDHSKQSGVEEILIRLPPAPREDPLVIAKNMGLAEGWKAYEGPGNRWKIIAPDGTMYKSKKAALEACHPSTNTTTSATTDEGDPPWRTQGHEYLGRSVAWTWMHRPSARRQIEITQIGCVTGWIRDTDLDRNGQPGFVDAQGHPAPLFHIEFPEEPNHPYANHLLATQDVEEYELVASLVPLNSQDKKDADNNNINNKKAAAAAAAAAAEEEEEPLSKKARTI
jgi:hypothetical protein